MDSSHTIWAVGVVSAVVVALAAWGLKSDRERIVRDGMEALRQGVENKTAIAILNSRAMADDHFKREMKDAMRRLEEQNRDQLLQLMALRAEIMNGQRERERERMEER